MTLTSTPAQDDPRLCRDCRWVKPTAWWDMPFLLDRYRFAKCQRPEAVFIPRQVNSVSGRVSSGEQHYCETMRDFDCGPSGKLWEPRG